MRAVGNDASSTALAVPLPPPGKVYVWWSPMKLVLCDTVYQIGLWYNIGVRGAMTPHPPQAVPLPPLGKVNIQHPRAASLPAHLT